MTGTKGPGIAKTRLRLLEVARSPRVRSVDARWRVLFEKADAVSEGRVQHETGGDVWYGSTSLILAYPETATPADREFLAAVAARDLHVRVRALRIARREAASRAPGVLGQSTCEIRFVTTKGGVRIDVDVQAPLIEGRHLGTSGK
jgi:hypothetical protein